MFIIPNKIYRDISEGTGRAGNNQSWSVRSKTKRALISASGTVSMWGWNLRARSLSSTGGTKWRERGWGRLGGISRGI